MLLYILICAIATPSDACTERTALDVVRPPHRALGPAAAGFQGMAMIAPTAIAPGPGQYLKIVYGLPAKRVNVAHNGAIE